MERDKHPRPRHAGGDTNAAAATLRRLPAYVYVSDLYRGRHVLEIGCGDGAGAAYLARAGAASVIGLDRSAADVDLARARHPLANLTFAAGDYAAIDLDDRAVDLIGVPDGAELARWPAFLDEARRVLARDGRIVMSVPNGDRGGATQGLSYHDLVGRLAPVFGDVRIVGVMPFVGFALVEYADVDLADLELDTTLAGPQPVADYLALAGAALGPARGHMLLQVPAAH